MRLEWLSNPEVWASVVTLTALEIVLGIDNVIFLAILAARLPPEQQNRARQVGLAVALISRLALLASIAWIMGLTRPVFDLFGHSVSWRDIVLIGGGFFLIYKGTREIHHRFEDDGLDEPTRAGQSSFAGIIAQIALLDVVFSLDSVITAVGMANAFCVMAAAIIIAVLVMLIASKPLTAFVEQYPTVKMLALSFLLLIGMTLVADGVGFHVPKGYVYAAIGFSVGVEVLTNSSQGDAGLAARVPLPGRTLYNIPRASPVMGQNR